MVAVAAAGEPYPGCMICLLGCLPCPLGVREAAEPSAAKRLPARDGSERRQIPCPFSGRIRGHALGSHETRIYSSLCGCSADHALPPRKRAFKGFDQSERVAVFWLLFCAKRVTAGVGRGAPPCFSQRYCELTTPAAGAQKNTASRLPPAPSVCPSGSQLPPTEGAFLAGFAASLRPR